MLRKLVLTLAAALATACGSSDGASVVDPISAHAVDPGNAGGNKFLTVMTRNLYVGGDLFLPFVAADPLLAASTVWGDILASDPAARMAAIADEIRAARPDVVALEEAYHFVVTPLGASSPVLLELDYLTFLEDALARCGGPTVAACRERCDEPPMRIAAVQPHTVLTVPFPAKGIQITMTDRDAILTDADVLVRSSAGGDFDAEFLATLAGVIPVHLKRGWVEVTAKHQGVPFTFVATHLETKDFGPLQSLQAMELLARFGSDAPVILAGDTNSDPHDPVYLVSGQASPIPTPYQLFATAFHDAASGVGDTCCFAGDLRPPSSLSERVDLVLTRGAISARTATRVGLDPLASLGDRWPSDHAGVVATVRLENERFFALHDWDAPRHRGGWMHPYYR